MNESASQVLKMFAQMGKSHEHVLDAIEGLQSEGLIASLGGDFYSLTEKSNQEITIKPEFPL